MRYASATLSLSLSHKTCPQLKLSICIHNILTSQACGLPGLGHTAHGRTSIVYIAHTQCGLRVLTDSPSQQHSAISQSIYDTI